MKCMYAAKMGNRVNAVENRQPGERRIKISNNE